MDNQCLSKTYLESPMQSVNKVLMAWWWRMNGIQCEGKTPVYRVIDLSKLEPTTALDDQAKADWQQAWVI